MNTNRHSWNRNLVVTALVISTLLVAGCIDGAPESNSVDRGERTIFVQTTEMDALRAADGFPEGFPHQTRVQYPEYFGDPQDHTDSSGAPGLYLFQADEDTYRIGSYLFLPSEVIAYQGEKITLVLFGVRGTEHANSLVDPDGNVVNQGTVWRGGIQEVQFNADKPGLWQLICHTHAPAQVMNIHVLAH